MYTIDATRQCLSWRASSIHGNSNRQLIDKTTARQYAYRIFLPFIAKVILPSSSPARFIHSSRKGYERFTAPARKGLRQIIYYSTDPDSTDAFISLIFSPSFFMSFLPSLPLSFLSYLYLLPLLTNPASFCPRDPPEFTFPLLFPFSQRIFKPPSRPRSFAHEFSARIH